jgi:hypothetical protein
LILDIEINNQFPSFRSQKHSLLREKIKEIGDGRQVIRDKHRDGRKVYQVEKNIFEELNAADGS